MKFGIKLMLCIIVMIAVILSCSRFIVIRQNFMYSIKENANQSMNQNTLERYYLESNIVNAIR